MTQVSITQATAETNDLLGFKIIMTLLPWVPLPHHEQEVFWIIQYFHSELNIFLNISSTHHLLLLQLEIAPENLAVNSGLVICP